MSEKRNQLARRIAPGFWVDAAGALHISIPELLEVFGWPDTPENRKRCFDLATETMKKLNPAGTQVQRTAHCPTCDSENVRVTELSEKGRGDFCCQDCLTFFCEPTP